MSSLMNLKLEGDGIVTNLFHFLWAKDEFDRGPEFNIPDTILFNYNVPGPWYFTSAANGKVKRKAKLNTVNVKIEHEFMKNSIGDNIIATYISLDGSSIEYFNEEGLREFLYERDKPEFGVLQKFIQPKGSSNAMIRAIWSPKLCMIERRTNRRKLHDRRYGLYERAVTFEGEDYFSVSDPVKGPLLAGGIRRLCQMVVEHVADVSYQKFRINRLALNMKVDSNDKCWLLWCTSLRHESLNKGVFVEQNAPLSMEIQTSVPEVVDKRAIQLDKIKQRVMCTSCAVNMTEDKTCDVNYKAIIAHFEQLLGYLANTVEGPIVWPPSEKAIRAAGNVGFGILSQLEKVSYNPSKSQNSIQIQIPPMIRYLHPDMQIHEYQRYKKDPIFLYKNATTCENCYLVYADFTTSMLETNTVHRGAPKILRPSRSKRNTRLKPLSSPARLTPDENIWAPIREKPSRKVSDRANKGLKTLSTPKVPIPIDPKLIREIRTQNEPTMALSELGGTSNDFDKVNAWLASTSTTEEENLLRKEEAFFTDMQANPNMDKSHPLSHLISSAAKIRTMNNTSNRKLNKSASQGIVKPGNPYSVKQSLAASKSYYPRASSKSKLTSSKQSSRGRAKTPGNKLITESTSAAQHREFLLKTLSEVKYQIDNPQSSLSNILAAAPLPTDEITEPDSHEEDNMIVAIENEATILDDDNRLTSPLQTLDDKRETRIMKTNDATPFTFPDQPEPTHESKVADHPSMDTFNANDKLEPPAAATHENVENMTDTPSAPVMNSKATILDATNAKPEIATQDNPTTEDTTAARDTGETMHTNDTTLVQVDKSIDTTSNKHEIDSAQSMSSPTNSAPVAPMPSNMTPSPKKMSSIQEDAANLSMSSMYDEDNKDILPTPLTMGVSNSIDDLLGSPFEGNESHLYSLSLDSPIKGEKHLLSKEYSSFGESTDFDNLDDSLLDAAKDLTKNA